MRKLFVLTLVSCLLGCEASSKNTPKSNWFTDPFSPANVSNPANPINPLNPTNPMNPSNILWK